jgi:hypothetical protein
MTASMFQGEGGYNSVVGENPKGELPNRVLVLGDE